MITQNEPAKSSQSSVDRRVVRLGGSLVVGVPNEVVEQWNLDKGDEVTITIEEGAVRIKPKQPTKVEMITEEASAAYSKAMRGVQARVTMDTNASAIRLEFSGENKEAVDLFVQNLWRNLPPLLRMLGLGSVEELTNSKGKESD